MGIGGIGMSALARYFILEGKEVWGYDRNYSRITNDLEEEGAKIIYKDEIELLKITPDLVIRTPAVPSDSILLNHFIKSEIVVKKRAEILGMITREMNAIGIAGTHGKTSISTILAHILTYSHKHCNAFLGGISKNYNTNFLHDPLANLAVVEADEFDRSFLQLRPDIACITSMDADHLDIYGDAAEIENAFRTFAQLVKKDESVFIQKNLPLDGMTVAIEESADYEAQNVKIKDGAYLFDLKTPNGILENLIFNFPGRHNLTNAIMALGMAILAGSPTDCLPRALATFKGVKRRFSYKIKSESLVLIDDYAHHRTEIDALFQAVNEMYPGDHKQIIFQPHLFSRTRDFAEAFAKSLSQFDEVVLLDIYPAREEPIEGITSEWLLNQIDAQHKIVVFKSALPEVLLKSKCRIKLLVGAGDIGAEVNKITQKLKNET